MNIQDWFNNGCNYQTGVQLYSQLPHNVNLLRIFTRKENSYNREKLKAELRKYLSVYLSEPEPILEKYNVKTYDKPVMNLEVPDSRFHKQPIAYYPLELHPVYKQSNESFYEACSLKMQLNQLSEENTEEALSIQQEIFRLWELNDQCFSILQHYETTKRILPLEVSEDYSQLNPQELVNKRQRLYANVSKRKKTLQKQEEKYLTMEEGKSKVLLFDKINAKKAELQALYLRIKKLTEKINENAGR